MARLNADRYKLVYNRVEYGKSRFPLEHVPRFVEACALGAMADQVFRVECKRRRINANMAMRPDQSPLLHIILSAAEGEPFGTA